MLLQDISYASSTVAALFVPRIRAWVREMSQAIAEPHSPQPGQNLGQALEILVKSGSDADRDFVEKTATECLAAGLDVPFASIWLPALVHLTPAAGVAVLERALRESVPSQTGRGVHLFAQLFCRDSGGLGVDLRFQVLPRRSCFDCFGWIVPHRVV